MSEKSWDYLVIGGGSGGIASANRAAERGAKVALIETGKLGGTCVNVGCVPKKVMWYLAKLMHELKAYGPDYGLRNLDQIALDYESFVARRAQYIERLNGIYRNNLKNNQVTLINGTAKFIDAHTVEVNGRMLQAKHILIATGGRPARPHIPGAAYGLTSDDIFSIKELPQKMVILGGGYIGVEMSGAFRNLGVEVEVVEYNETLLKGFEEFIIDSYMDIAQREGFEGSIHTGVHATAIEKVASGYRVHLSSGAILETDMVLWAAGRKPNTHSLNLESAGVQVDEHGFIIVDKWQQTSTKGIYAVGDVTGAAALTPVAIKAGRYLSERLFNHKVDWYLDERLVPTVIFAEPPIGTIGLTEKQAREIYGDTIKVYTSTFTAMHSAITENRQKAYLKLITQGPFEKIIGLHGIGQGMDELLEGFTVAITMGATKDDFDRTIAIHPTVAEEFVTMR
ncbi:glutathione-disulfide reductase [Allofustis seminis]|uniref:glutathione-disulfide reductase n=1 Tax=Allofustis seminis TaxID=166939 RepID=UPI000370D1E2|nr:glutathione-disulfide reductase [Allofustis seminis]